MTIQEFNEKYKEYLEEGHYGLGLDNPKIIDYLDNKFQELIKIPGFKFQQIKAKFNWYRFYANIDHKICSEIENELQLVDPLI